MLKWRTGCELRLAATGLSFTRLAGCDFRDRVWLGFAVTRTGHTSVFVEPRGHATVISLTRRCHPQGG